MSTGQARLLYTVLERSHVVDIGRLASGFE